MARGPSAHREEGLLAVAGAGLMLCASAGVVLFTHLDTAVPYYGWSPASTRTWAVALCSAGVLAVAGPWLLWRLPTNPTGWWLTGTGACLSLWMIGTFTSLPPSAWAQHLLPPFAKAALVVAVLRWPTGRLPARWDTPILAAILAYLTMAVGSEFIGLRVSRWPPDERALPAVGSLVVGGIGRSVAAVLMSGVAALVFVAVAHRRQVAMPPSVQATTWPAYAGALVLGLSELWSYLAGLVTTPLDRSTTSLSRVGQVGLAVDLARFGIVALLLVWSEAMRRRAARSALPASVAVEVGSAADDSPPLDDLAAVVGDPTVRLAFRQPDGSWVPPLEELADAGGGERDRIEITDDRGRVVALVDHSRDSLVSRVTRDATMASIGLAIARSSRHAAAEHRRVELRQIQREVLDAQDRARRRLERDLHDGVQQRLIAVALDASLLARRESNGPVTEAARAQLANAIDACVEDAVDLLARATPGFLDPGLAAGLTALAATVPLPTRLALDGDVDAADPAATALWFVAAEAVSNSLKHAHARHLRLSLATTGRSAELQVSDDGVGGVATPPASILDRLADLVSTVEVRRATGGGTAIVARVRLLDGDEASCAPTARPRRSVRTVMAR